MEEDYILPDIFNERNIVYGKFANGKFNLIEIIENEKKIYIRYLNNNKYVPFNFTFDGNNVNWKNLPKCYFKKNEYNISIVTFIFENLNNTFIINFMYMLNKLKLANNFKIENLLDKKNKKEILLNEIFKITDNKLYINNVKIKYDYNDRNIIKSNIQLKQNCDGILSLKGICDYEFLLNKYFHIMPKFRLTGLYMKEKDDKIEIFHDIYLEEAVIYKTNNDVDSNIPNNKFNIEKITINDEDYIF